MKFSPLLPLLFFYNFFFYMLLFFALVINIITQQKCVRQKRENFSPSAIKFSSSCLFYTNTNPSHVVVSRPSVCYTFMLNIYIVALVEMVRQYGTNVIRRQRWWWRHGLSIISPRTCRVVQKCQARAKNVRTTGGGHPLAELLSFSPNLWCHNGVLSYPSRHSREVNIHHSSSRGLVTS